MKKKWNIKRKEIVKKIIRKRNQQKKKNKKKIRKRNYGIKKNEKKIITKSKIIINLKEEEEK